MSAEVIFPADEAAQRCAGAGVIVAGANVRATLVDPLVAFGYFVIALDKIASVDELAAAIATLEVAARGKLGAIGVDASSALVLEAATVLPQLDAVVLINLAIPNRNVKLDRLRAQVQIHYAERARKALTSGDLHTMRQRAQGSDVAILDWAYTGSNATFITEASADTTLAFGRIRDFFSQNLL